MRCGIVLAAGEGTRLRPLVTRLLGEALPKQYVSFVGTRSMLEHTIDRAERLIPAERVFTVISERHLEHRAAARQLAGRPPHTVILQPENRDTGPGLLLPLAHVHRRFPEAIVAVFPSDHFIREESLFMAHVGAAFGLVDREPSRVVLLGVEPGRPEPEYGYILPGEDGGALARPGARPVARFVEKPPLPLAGELTRRGGLWNTLVMIFRARTLLDLTRDVHPELARAFEHVEEALGTPEEPRVVRETYRNLRPLNLSRDLLELLPLRHPSRLTVLTVRGVEWSDWGTEERVVSTLRAEIPRAGGGTAAEAGPGTAPAPAGACASI